MPDSRSQFTVRNQLLARLRWDSGGVDTPVAGDPATIARAFAYLFGSGGLLGLASLLLPHAPDRHALGVAAPALAALIMAAYILWRFDRLTYRFFLLMPPLGSLLITVVILSGGAAVVAVYAMLYIWVVLAAFWFLTRRAGLFNLAFVGAVYLTGMLIAKGTTEVTLRWLMAMGTLTVAGLLIGALRGRVEDLVTALRRRSEQQDVVAEVGRRALSGADFEQLASWAAHAVAHNLEVEHAAVFNLVEGEKLMLLRAGVGWNPEVTRTAAVSVDEPLLARALESVEPVIEQDDSKAAVAERREFDADRHGAPATGCRRLPPNGHGATGIAVAIHGHQEPSGVLAAYSCSGRRFGSAEAAFIQSVANVLADATRRREAEELARRQAMLDPLTGRPNRVLFLDRLNEALLRSRESEAKPAVLVVDIDDFRLINEASGHEVGDALLQAFAPRLRQSLVMTDTVARIGADEFAILCEDSGGEGDTIRIAETILDSLREPFAIGPESYRMSACIGISFPDESGAGADAVIAQAGAATQRAKDRGHGRYELFDEAVQRRLRTRLDLGQAFREAPGKGELSLAIQPIHRLQGGPVHSSEVLLRWQHPHLGAISPAEFIPVAEETGVIVEVGEWVLGEACRLAAAWLTDAESDKLLPLNVNVSPRQLVQADFSGMVANSLSRFGLAPADVGLEVTEHALLHDYDAASRTLASLREMGVSILLDDFGTGYSSLNHLKLLPIDVVKIDGTFIHGLQGSSRDVAIVTAVFGMASAFGIDVVAEGVETAEQAELLRELGCPLAQGYYFGRPAPPEALAPSVSIATSASSRLE